MKELIEEIMFELLRMTVEELEEFREEWKVELEKKHAREYAKSVCITLVDVVLEHKLDAVERGILHSSSPDDYITKSCAGAKGGNEMKSRDELLKAVIEELNNANYRIVYLIFCLLNGINGKEWGEDK